MSTTFSIEEISSLTVPSNVRTVSSFPNTRFNIVFGVISADSKVSSLCFSYARVVRAEI